jgi:hypothetical protein
VVVYPFLKDKKMSVVSSLWNRLPLRGEWMMSLGSGESSTFSSWLTGLAMDANYELWKNVICMDRERKRIIVSVLHVDEQPVVKWFPCLSIALN